MDETIEDQPGTRVEPPSAVVWLEVDNKTANYSE